MITIPTLRNKFVQINPLSVVSISRYDNTLQRIKLVTGDEYITPRKHAQIIKTATERRE